MQIRGLLVSGELPRTCKACILFTMLDYEGFDLCVFDRFSEEDIPIDYYDKLAKKGERPPWCPLTNKITDLMIQPLYENSAMEKEEKNDI